jgi:hypothetical protein
MAEKTGAYMFVPQPIGFVSSPYHQTSEIPKGLHAKHEAEGVLKLLPEFEPGLIDIEGFSGPATSIWSGYRPSTIDPTESLPLGLPVVPTRLGLPSWS